MRERLRDGVQKALEILGTGLLSHPENNGLRDKFESSRLAKIDYYAQLLRLIYRLLFLMVAEERRLLFVRDSKIADRQEVYDRWYSIERLRKRADSRFFEDGHSDLWEGPIEIPKIKTRVFPGRQNPKRGAGSAKIVF